MIEEYNINPYNSYDDYDYYYREHKIDYTSRILRWGDLKNNTTIGKREIYFRGGIMPYRRTVLGNFEVCLGITNNPRFKTATYIGGGRDPTDNIILDTAIREFQEETGGRLLIDPITDNTVCYDCIDSTIFLVYSNTKEQIVDLKNISAKPELSILRWVPIQNGRLSLKGITLNKSLQTELDRKDGLFDQFYKYMCLEALQSTIQNVYTQQRSFDESLRSMVQLLNTSSMLFEPSNNNFDLVIRQIEDILYHKTPGYYEEKFNDIKLLIGEALFLLLKEKILIRRPKLGEIILDNDAKLLNQHLIHGRYYFTIVVEDLYEIQRENYYVRLSGVMYVIDANIISLRQLTDMLSAYTGGQVLIFVRKGVNLSKGVKHRQITLDNSIKRPIIQLVDEYSSMALDSTNKKKNIYVAALFMTHIVRIEERDYFTSIGRSPPINTFDLETDKFLDEDSNEDINENRELKTLGNASKFVEFAKPEGYEKRLQLLISLNRNAI